MGRVRDAEEEEEVEEVEEEEEEATASDKRPDLRVEMHCIFSAVWPSPTRKCVEGSREAVEPGAVGTQDVLFRRVN